MRVLDLFSGIGGFSLGLGAAGMETVAFCEIQPFCQKVLAKHWPDVPIYSDITALTAERLADDGISDIGLVCGGFPCQPFSNAGKRKGAEDDRHLWPEMLRVIREVQPNIVIGENVAGIINMELDGVLSDLEALGYSCGAFVIPACAVDAGHRRDRAWIVAHSDSIGPQERTDECRPGRASNGGIVSGHKDNGVFAQKADSNSGCGKQPSRGVHFGVGRENKSISGYRSIKRPTEPPLCRATDGIPQRLDRLKSLGNAVVPQVVEEIGRAIMGEVMA